MAISMKSILGNWVGVTRETTTLKGFALFSRRGFIGPALYISATEPTNNSTSSIVDVEGFTTVTSLATGTAAVAVRGVSIVTSGASSLYTMAGPPGVGIRRTLVTTSTSTANRQITSAAAIIAGLAQNIDSGSIATASTSMTVLTFNALGQAIELVSLSTSVWLNTNLRGYSTSVSPLSS